MENNVINIEDLALKRDTFIALLSARNSGKSYLIANLIHYFLTNENQRIDYMYLFSNTAGLNTDINSQYRFIDKKAIIPVRQDIMEKAIRGLMRSQGVSKFRFKILLVFDDIVLSNKYHIIEELATMGRHLSITVILSSQISNQAVSPIIRNNISYLLFRRLTQSALKDNVYPILGTAFENPVDLVEFTNASINNFQFVFLNNNEDLNNESIQIIKAHEIPKTFSYKVKLQEEPRKNNLKRMGSRITLARDSGMLRPNFDL